MRLLRTVRQNPIAILYLAVIGMITWVAVDLAEPGKPRKEAAVPQLAEVEAGPSLVFPAVVAALDRPLIRKLPPPPHALLADLLPKLRPGMSRAEVEILIGAPASDRVTAVDDRLTYRTAYELAETETPMTIRPIRPGARVPAPTLAADPALVALEFDASRPGHPLLEILFLDPLF